MSTPKKFKNSAVLGTEKMRAFWYRGYFFLQHLTFNFDVAFFCFSTWGESSFKACQTCFLVFLYFYYTKRTVAAILFPFLYGAIAYVLLSGLIPISILVQLTSLNILLLSISRVSSLKIMLIACSELAARFINLGKERGGGVLIEPLANCTYVLKFPNVLCTMHWRKRTLFIQLCRTTRRIWYEITPP